MVRRSLLVVLFLALVALAITLSVQREVSAYPQTSLVAKQFDSQSCILGAVATHLNYRKGSADYTARGLALAYTAKYGTSDWWLDGNTSHQAQDLSRYAGVTPVYGKLTDDPADPVGRMKALAYYGKYPVVFLAGAPEHAIVLVGAVNDTIAVADPWDGTVRNYNAYSLYSRLEAQKWVFYTEG